MIHDIQFGILKQGIRIRFFLVGSELIIFEFKPFLTKYFFIYQLSTGIGTGIGTGTGTVISQIKY